MKRIAVICAILEEPTTSQMEFNRIVSDYHHMVQGRMGIPFQKDGIAAISLTVVGTMNEINSLTGKLGKLPNVFVKTAVSQKEVESC